MLFVIGLIGAAIAVGAFIVLGYKLTKEVIKKYRIKKATKIFAAHVKEMIKTAHEVKLDEWSEDDVILAEYDEEKEELVQDVCVAHSVDERVGDILKNNKGIVVFT